MDSDLLNVALNLQKKYTKFNEIYDLTKQMEESLYRDDLYSLKLVLKMRTEAMAEAERIEYKRKDLIDSIPEEKKGHIISLMSKNADISTAASDIEKKINSIYKQIKVLVDKTVALDKIVNQKINKKGTIRL